MKPRLAGSGTLISPIDPSKPTLTISQIRHDGILKPESPRSVNQTLKHGGKGAKSVQGVQEDDNITVISDIRRGSLKSLRPTVFSPPPKVDRRTSLNFSLTYAYAIIVLLTMAIVVVVVVFVAVELYTKHSPSVAHDSESGSKDSRNTTSKAAR